MILQTIKWDSKEHSLLLLDQRLIPDKTSFVKCIDYFDVANSIVNMTVRGAPAIGVVAAYGVAMAAHKDITSIDKALKRLAATRPTAVNLYWALLRMEKIYQNNINDPKLAFILEEEAIKIHNDDAAINKKLSDFGQALIPDNASVITYCNAGALATAGHGTALGVFKSASQNGKKLKIYACETRPRMQGGLLTSFELDSLGLDVTVICDLMSAFLMSKEKIDAVVTGADRIAANGDTANKIGTYGLAIAAREHNVPFYIAAPLSTFDINCPCGNMIPIEERDGDEIRVIKGVRLIPENIKVWNPAFDVTPSKLISGIITEAGILLPPYEDSIKKVFRETEEGA